MRRADHRGAPARRPKSNRRGHRISCGIPFGKRLERIRPRRPRPEKHEFPFRLRTSQKMGGDKVRNNDEIFLPIPAEWGKMRPRHNQLKPSENLLTGALRTARKLRIDKIIKTSRNKPSGEAQRSNTVETREATTMRATKARNMYSNEKDVSPEQREELLRALKARFEKNMNRHQELEWAKVR